MQIYEPNGKAREYSPLALNYVGGCTHKCLYCYANDPKQNRLILPTDKDFQVIEESAKKFYGCNKQILLSFMSDPYCTPNVTRNVLEILNKYEHKVSILTKAGAKVLEHIDLFKKFKSYDLFEPEKLKLTVGFSLTFDNAVDSKKWESGASSPEERIKVIEILHSLGFKVWISFEPVIYPDQSIRLMEKVAGFVDHIRIGKINNFENLDKNIDWNKFIKDSVSLCRTNGINFYIKDDLASYNKETELQPKERDMNFYNL